jgi:hypothetical protein
MIYEKLHIAAGLCLLLSTFGYGQNVWNTQQSQHPAAAGKRFVEPITYRALSADAGLLRSRLFAAPHEDRIGHPLESNLLLPVPMPDGSMDTFAIVQYDMMEPELADRYPNIRTFRGISKTSPYRAIRCDWTSFGFHAKIYGPEQPTIYIDPYSNADVERYVAYYEHDLPAPDAPHACHSHGQTPPRLREQEVGAPKALDCKFRSYRLAVAATGEYSNYFGASSSGQSGLVLSAITTAMGYINGIFEQEAGVRMVLVADTEDVFFYDTATDDYTENDLLAMTDENQTTLDAIIEPMNYDVGHVFHKSNLGGLAYINVVCWSGGYNAGGVSSTSSPGNASFYNLAAHEFGHMFAAVHSYNSDVAPSCLAFRNDTTAYEPGSGSSLMAYAGICDPQNVQISPDEYFHAESRSQIFDDFLTIPSNNDCEVVIFTGTPPTVSTPAAFTIPHSTPFSLTAIGSHVNDLLTYCWEQMDLGPAGVPVATNTTGPMFRSRPPSSSGTRYFPRLEDVISGAPTPWEVLPSVARTLNFRATVRGFSGGYGCSAVANTTITVSSNGPFAVTQPNTNVSWQGGQTYTVNWDVVGSDAYCSNVDILLSSDGGLTYPTTLATATANDGTHNVTIPTIPSTLTTARMMVRGSGNVFYDISNMNFTLLAGVLPVELLYFEAAVEEKKVQLSWATATERNNAGFRIERSEGTAASFQSVGWVAGKGDAATENRYALTDTDVKSGQTYYYRLRQTDFDDTETLSDVQVVRIAGEAEDILVYPNPALDELYVQLAQPDEKGAQLEVLDVQGRSLGQWVITESVHRVDTKQWASGQYILRIVTGGKVCLKRVLIRS